MNHAMSSSIRVGVSSCLLGEKVRYDGGHKHDRFVTDQLGRFVELVPVCPELEAGMGVPREPVRLEEGAGGLRMVEVEGSTDHTKRMLAFSGRRVRQLKSMDLCGYVLKRGSPSCGMERVRVYHATKKAPVRRNGRGLFAHALIEAMPNLPVEEEGRLCDERLRENFIERVFAYRRLRDLFGGRWTVADAIRFHTVHKLQVTAHDPPGYRELGRLVAAVRSTTRAEFRRHYEARFMAALAKPVSEHVESE